MFKIIVRYAFLPAFLLLLGFQLYHFYLNKSATSVTTAKQAAKSSIGGDFQLINHKGEAVSAGDYAGKLMLVYFGFTHCPDICPTDLTNITAALNAMNDKERSNIWPIFITIDPDRDTVEQMSDYLSNFHNDIQGLTGTKEKVLEAIKAYKVYSQKVTSDDMNSYLMNHSAYTYLMDRGGNYLAHFGHAEDIEKMLITVRKHI